FQESPEYWEMQAQLQDMEAWIAERVEQSRNAGVLLPLVYAADVFGLTVFERRCLLVCLAVEVHRKYEKLYAFLQDDVTCKHPTVDLVLNLLCTTPMEMMAAREVFSPNGTLCRYF